MNENVHELKSYNGWRFCPYCKNLLNPFKETDNPEVLLFKCSSNKCGNQGLINVKISLGNKESALLMKKDYQAAKAIDITDPILRLDPSMPRKQITCEICFQEKAVYFIKAEEKNLVIQYICINCEHKWTASTMDD